MNYSKFAVVSKAANISKKRTPSAARKAAGGDIAPVRKKAQRKNTPGTITQRVIPFGNGWVVKPDHTKEFFAVTTTQAQAIHIATELAKSDRAHLIIHNRNGTVRAEKSFVKAS